MSVVLAMILCFSGTSSCETILIRQMLGPQTCLAQAKMLATQIRSPGQKHWRKALKGNFPNPVRLTVECRWETSI